MSIRKKYLIIVEDESHLETRFRVRTSPVVLWIVASAAILGLLVVAGVVISVTPIRTLLPGYMKESQRAATEESLLRLDSIREQYETNQAFLDNYLRVTDTERTSSDSVAITPMTPEVPTDSLMGPSNRERQFVSAMEERERFNISVLAPLAADGIMFSPVTSDGIFSSDSRTSEEGRILLPSAEGIRAAADGSVIAVYFSAAERGFEVVVQHGRGFVSAYSHTGTPLVGVSDKVDAGQVIALSPAPDAMGVRWFGVRMWHNGLAIIPYRYIGPTVGTQVHEESYEAPRGKL